MRCPRRVRAGESATHAAVPVAPATPSAPPRPTRRRALAAMAAVFAAAGGGWFGWEAWRSEPVFEQRYQTQRGQQLDVALPDGSQMRLDTATTAEVSLYRGRREVRLAEGQAMFTVQSDKARPFDVRAGGTRVTVVGTRFSVRYTPSIGRPEVQVAVQEGRVRVAAASDAAAPAAIELAPGETVAADAQGRPGPVARIAPEGVAAWRGNRLSFDNLPLSAVLAELGRYGDVGIAVHDPAVAALPVTASVDLQRMGDFVRSLPQVLPVRLERRQGTTEIVAAKH
jgi:transmembrane sensor